MFDAYSPLVVVCRWLLSVVCCVLFAMYLLVVLLYVCDCLFVAVLCVVCWILRVV